MNRHRSSRFLTSLVGPTALAATLAFGVVGQLPAQDTGKSSQTEPADKKAREQAELFIKDARKALARKDFGAAEAMLARAKTADATAPGIEALSKDIVKGRSEASSKSNKVSVDNFIASAKGLLKQDKFDEAERQLAMAAELDPGNEKVKKLRDQVAEERIEAQSEAVKGSVDERIARAREAVSKKNFDAARRAEADARKVSGGAFAKELDKLSADIAKAENSFNAEKNKGEISRLLEEADARIDQGQYELARQSLNNVFKLDKENSKATKLLAEADKKERAEASKSGERAAANAVKEADQLLRAGKPEAAAVAYKGVLAKSPNDSGAKDGLKKAVDAIVKEGQAALDKGDKATASAKLATAKGYDSSSSSVKKFAEEVAEASKPVVAAKPAEPVKPAPTPAPRPTPAAIPVMQNSAASTSSNSTAPKSSTSTSLTSTVSAAKPTTSSSSASTTTSTSAKPAASSVKSSAAPAAKPAASNDDAKKEAARKAEEAKKEAEEAKKKAEREKKEQEEKAKSVENAEKRKRAEAAYHDGVSSYEKGDLVTARRRWTDAKEIDPSYTKPDSYLENTEKEYNALLSTQAQKEQFETREAEALDKMNTLIQLRTLEPTNLADFLQNLRILSGIDFVIAGETKAKVEVAFEDQPLTKVLDSTLLPIGLRWSREPGSSTVIISPDLRTEVFTATPEQLTTIKALIADNTIARLLYGPQGTPVLQGQEIYADDRQNLVVMTDSSANLEKFRRFLESLSGGLTSTLGFDSFEIDERQGPKVKAMLDAVLASDDQAPFNTERKLILEGSTLIIKDTRENIEKVRALLLDQNFITKIYTDTLDVRTFNLTPVVEFDDNPDLILVFTDQVRQVVETLLYAKEGKQKAEREGRRLWYDAVTKQLTIVDYPDKLEVVQNYIESLPQIRSRRRDKIIFLDWAAAEDLVSQIEEFLGVSASSASTEASGTEVTKTMRVEDELTFNGATFRVTRVNENDAADENDDSVEMVVRTGTASQDVTLDEFRSEFVEEYEIVAEDVKPSSTPGEGRAKLTIRVSDQNAGDQDQQQEEQQQQEAEREQAQEETGLTLVAIENLNALFVQYDNIEDLRQVEFWVKTLDIPTLQVSIEIKFVEVVTNKANELKPEFIIGDLTESLTLSDSVLQSRFAQDRDEIGSQYEPLPESANGANLLKGSTVFNYIVSNGNSPISFQLKVLEAQGIINVVNGPTVTVLNKQSAEFIIEQAQGVAAPVQGSTGGGTTTLQAVTTFKPVDLSVTPTVTRVGNITLDIDVDMQDKDQNLGRTAQVASTVPNTGGTATTTTTNSVQNTNELAVIRKQLTTQARIKDGGTVVLGGWRNERTENLESGIPILRDIPFIGKYLFERSSKKEDKITLLIFLTGSVVRD